MTQLKWPPRYRWCLILYGCQRVISIVYLKSFIPKQYIKHLTKKRKKQSHLNFYKVIAAGTFSQQVVHQLF